MTTATTADAVERRPMRADARRNYDKLIAAARDAFTADGVDASLEDIARRAGVGIGTLYRHFPTRQELIEATYVEEVEALCASADGFADLPPWEALVGWLDRFTEYAATKRALASELLAVLGSEAVVFRTCHDAIWQAGEPLLWRAQQARTVRADIEFIDLVRMVSGLTMIKNTGPDDVRRILAFALDGIRFGAGER